MCEGNRPNFLDFVPRRKVDCARDQDGRSVLLVPKFGRGRMGSFAASLLGARAMLKIHLDDLGSRTWDAIDGSRTVGEIAGLVHVGTDGGIPEVHERCSRFMKMLSEASAVTLDSPCGKDGGRGV